MTDQAPASLHALWDSLRSEAVLARQAEPALAALLDDFILKRAHFGEALAWLLADALATDPLDRPALQNLFTACHAEAPRLIDAAYRDLTATLERDPAATSPMVPFLFFKGFHALQAYRLAHEFYRQGRPWLALSLQATIARRFGVDIHPAAAIGRGIMLDHAQGLVIGETAVVEDNVSLLHNVTLGGTGKASGDRHPKIRSGAMIGAGATILGNIEVGAGARIAAGSIVLSDVPPHVTVAGSPARIVGNAGCAIPAAAMDQMLPDPASVK